MTIIYRVLSLVINVIASVLAISLLFSIPLLLSSPVTMLSAFMMIAVILYSWFSFKFRREVLHQQKTVKHSLKDWVRVNGIVTLIFSFMTVISVVPLLQNPQLFTDSLKQMGYQLPLKSITGFLYVMLCYAAILLIHILWTFALMRKHQEYFK